MSSLIDFVLHLGWHTVLDITYLIPYLYVTYLILEYIEHHAQTKIYKFIQSANRLGPLYGAIAAPISGCGLSVTTANLYATRLISIGTLIAVFLATADEMLPMLISAKINNTIIIQIVIFKTVFALSIGFLLDYIFKKKEQPIEINNLCKHEQCGCHHESIFKSALIHTIRISIFIYVISFMLNAIFELTNTQFLNDLTYKNPIGGIFIAALVGLIPNCAISIGLTQLYIDNVLPIYALIAASFSNAGVGLLVFYKSTRSGMDTLKIIGILFGCSIIGGIMAWFIL